MKKKVFINIILAVKTRFWIITLAAFLITAALIALLWYEPSFLFSGSQKRNALNNQTANEIVDNTLDSYQEANESAAQADTRLAKIVLAEGESIIAVLTEDFNSDQFDEQLIAYRKINEQNGPVYLCYAAYDADTRGYIRRWDISTAVSRPGTVNLFADDFIGDHSICAAITGISVDGNHVLTVLRKNQNKNGRPFDIIADISIDGAINFEEPERNHAYSLGWSSGECWQIIAYGHDTASDNILDQIELSYSYDKDLRRYSLVSNRQIPGSQIEQATARQLLTEGVPVFESFLNGLWYYTNSDGSVDGKQFLFFDADRKEVVYYTDGVWQAYSWSSSNYTRNGIFISTVNNLISTMRRQIDIELLSLSQIRIRVYENLNLKDNMGRSWDGIYRKSQEASKGSGRKDQFVQTYRNIAYTGNIGRLAFKPDGEYDLEGGTQSRREARRGLYAFYNLEGNVVLELRPGIRSANNESYLVTEDHNSLILLHIDITTEGIRDLLEEPIVLTLE